MTEYPDLLALLGSRICHDLISPIGAIGNGVELLTMSAGDHSPEVALIAQSVANANARIRFFRVGFGLSGPDQRIGRPEVTGLLADLTRGGRLAIDWAGPADLPRREVKLAFLLLMCLEATLPYGGQIMVERGESRWQIVAHAPKMKVEPELWRAASGDAAPQGIIATQVQFALVAQELARQGRKLSAEFAEDEIRLAF